MNTVVFQQPAHVRRAGPVIGQPAVRRCIINQLGLADVDTELVEDHLLGNHVARETRLLMLPDCRVLVGRADDRLIMRGPRREDMIGGPLNAVKIG